MYRLLIITFIFVVTVTASIGQTVNIEQLGGEWDGVLEYADFSSERRVQLKTRLYVDPKGDKKTADLRFLFDDFGKVYRSKEKLKIDPEKKTWFYDGQDLPYVQDGNTLVATGTIMENGKKVPLRLTVKIEKESFSILKETRSPLKFRNKYSFRKADIVTEEFPLISTAQLKEDVRVFRATLEEFHPALYRYADKEEVDRRFDVLAKGITKPMREDKFVAKIAEFLSGLKCYHTYVNPFNQSKDLKRRLNGRRTFIPFYFDVVSGKFIITANASSKKLPIGSEIKKINGVSVDKIINKLLTVSNADGNGTPGNRLASIGLGPENGSSYALFDIYFPIFFAVKSGTFKIEAIDFKTNKNVKFEVFSLTQKERVAEMEKRYGATPGYDEGWEATVDKNGTAYLKMSNFITWKLGFKAKDFIKNAFTEFRTKKATSLIVDIRGNGGGDSDISKEVARYISKEKIPCRFETRTLIRTAKPAPELLKYTSSYEPLIKRALTNGLPPQAYKKSDIAGLLEYLPDSAPCKAFEPYPQPFQGKVYMIIDANNSSAAYSFAFLMKKLKLATLVGQMTGGNNKGFNGGSYLFTTLPNSGIEFDIPIFGYYSTVEAADAGVVPDVSVVRSHSDIGVGLDRELRVVRELIAKDAHK